jgi:hypothetical protein
MGRKNLSKMTARLTLRAPDSREFFPYDAVLLFVAYSYQHAAR